MTKEPGDTDTGEARSLVCAASISRDPIAPLARSLPDIRS